MVLVRTESWLGSHFPPMERAMVDRDARLETDPVIEAYKQHVDRTLLRENLRRTVQERVDRLVALQQLASEARRAGRAARNPQ